MAEVDTVEYVELVIKDRYARAALLACALAALQAGDLDYASEMMALANRSGDKE